MHIEGYVVAELSPGCKLDVEVRRANHSCQSDPAWQNNKPEYLLESFEA